MWTFWSSGEVQLDMLQLYRLETRSKNVLLERNLNWGHHHNRRGLLSGLFHAWGKQVIAGIGWELVAKSVEVDGRKLQDFTKVHRSHVPHHVDINGNSTSSLPKKPA